MEIELLDGTTENPLQKMGYNAGVCWAAPLDDAEKNRKRAISCIKAGHGRVLEYVDVEMVISGASARCLRELYTHIGGSPTRLQSSTRYVSEEQGFGYYIPPKIENNEELKPIYEDGMELIQKTYNSLMARKATKEDAANILPLGMESKMVWKINLRALINFMNRRLCTRALKEIRDLSIEIKDRLAEKNEEWAWIATNLFVPTCEIYKYRNPNLVFCPEQQCCGKHKKIEELNVLG
ncbi:MAG: FAD-dependent thymidylate synthase [Alphaproteobacteria bacterium]|nr:FAD-dependent thymidylate synthase [Alphaproteobacteria bacterium]